MNWGHLLVVAIVTGWVLSVEWRLWVKLRILTEQMKVSQRKERDHLRAVEK